MSIEIVEYDPRWSNLYEQARSPLAEALGSLALDIQHVGSTSVPGLAAKPIIDIAVAITSYPLSSATIEAVEALGYEHRGENGIPRREYFTRKTPFPCHVHMNELDSEDYRNLVLFRDYLRAHPQAAHQYEQLKRDIFPLYAKQRPGHQPYTEGKTPFVLDTLAKARAWRETSA